VNTAGKEEVKRTAAQANAANASTTQTSTANSAAGRRTAAAPFLPVPVLDGEVDDVPDGPLVDEPFVVASVWTESGLMNTSAIPGPGTSTAARRRD
jgi:hypothetical protein